MKIGVVVFDEDFKSLYSNQFLKKIMQAEASEDLTSKVRSLSQQVWQVYNALHSPGNKGCDCKEFALSINTPELNFQADVKNTISEFNIPEQLNIEKLLPNAKSATGKNLTKSESNMKMGFPESSQKIQSSMEHSLKFGQISSKIQGVNQSRKTSQQIFNVQDELLEDFQAESSLDERQQLYDQLLQITFTH